jgi:hypothetical protein
LPDEYDLLIYAKNGNRPQHLEHLAEVFPQHVQIHYGRYRREEMFEATRRSRAYPEVQKSRHLLRPFREREERGHPRDLAVERGEGCLPQVEVGPKRLHRGGRLRFVRTRANVETDDRSQDQALAPSHDTPPRPISIV